MKNAILFFGIILLVFGSSCRKEEFQLRPEIALQCSTDTILFDTVFVTAGSITKRVKIYNPSNKDLKIEEVFLAGLKFTGKSNYRLNINGQATNAVNGLEIASKDSAYIFAEVTIDPNAEQLPFIVRDSIILRTGDNEKRVYLEAYGQNARFFNSEELVCNSTWTNDLPVVVYNSVLVPENCRLTIQSGTKIYFNSGSFLFVAGSLIALGTEAEPIVFRGDRLDEFYRDQAGAWGGLHFLQNSKDSRIDYAQILNGLIGVRVDSLALNTRPKLEISNTIIKNHVLVGLLGYTASVLAYNNLINDCGRFAVAALLGGDWTLWHNTIGNYSFNFSRNDPSLVLSNADLLDENDLFLRSNDLSVDMRNCIVWGDREEEAILDQGGTGAWTADLSYNLIRTKEVFGWTSNNKFNIDPKFVDPLEGDYSIDSLSVAFGAGFYFTPATEPQLEFDLLRQRRQNPPTLGAIERIE